MLSASQIDALRARLPQPKAQTGDAPRVLIPSALSLSLDQETNLIEACRLEKQRLSQLTGRMDYTAQDWVTNLKSHMSQHGQEVLPFFAERHLALMMMEGNVGWRKEMWGGLWAESNMHIPIVGRIIPQQTARACDSFFGTSPWMTATPIGMSDTKLADQITQYSRHVADQSELEAAFREGISVAFPLGEQVVKLHYDTRLDYFETVMTVAHQPDGTPFHTQDGDYVFETDIWDPVAPPADPTLSPEQHQELKPQTFVLRREASKPIEQQTPYPAWWNQHPGQWKRAKITRENVRFNGVRATNLYYLDFLCDPAERDIQEAKTILHIRSDQLIGFIHGLLTSDAWAQHMPSPEQRQEVIARIINELSGTGAGTGLAADLSRPEAGDASSTRRSDRAEPQLTIDEYWMHFDANGDGAAESIMVLMTPDGIPIYYDYAANMTPDGLRPFEVIRVNPVPGRWHGTGQVKKFYALQLFADLLLNRINFAQTSSGRVTFWNPKATIEGASNPHLKLNWGGTYTLTGDTKPADCLHNIYLENIKGDELFRLLELILQMAMNMSGVSSVNDGMMAGLDTTKLATGVKSMENSGQELFSSFLSDLTPPIRRVVKRFLVYIFGNLKKDELFTFFEGDTAAFATITPEMVRGMTLHVTIDLSKYNEAQTLAQSSKVAQIMREFFAYQPPMMLLAHPIYLRMVKSTGMPNAEKYFPTVENIQSMMMQMLSQPPASQTSTSTGSPAGASTKPGSTAETDKPATSLV